MHTGMQLLIKGKGTIIPRQYCRQTETTNLKHLSSYFSEAVHSALKKYNVFFFNFHI